ncbi:hypothetical protein Cal7507_4351 [Calothrix sp. PCC 7507]|nr:hypothetical protein Cal7507_4351 [Calothrix sp. PCC 7507]
MLQKNVGWVEERTPTKTRECWVTLREAAPRLRKASTQPMSNALF